jgi:general secretion pathway protein D
MKEAIFFFIFAITVLEGSLEELISSRISNANLSENSFEKEIGVINPKLSLLKAELSTAYNLANQLANSKADEEEFKAVLEKTKFLKSEIANLEKSWKDASVKESKKEEEGYGLWDQEETTLSQLILEYGSSDFLYIIPPDLASMKLNLYSAIPVPREAWSDLLEIVLAHNGVGVKQINAYSRQLYSMKQDLISASIITSRFEHLASLPDLSRVIYLFSPPPEYFKTAYHFLERFRDPKRTFVYTVGSKIALVSTKEEALKLIELYDGVWSKSEEKITRVVSCNKLKTTEMEKILKAFFGSTVEGNRYSGAKGVNEISIMPISQENSLVLVGSRDLVSKAEQIIDQTQSQCEIPCEMTIFWYNCKHSDPNDLAEVLQKVYHSLVSYQMDGSEAKLQDQTNVNVNIEQNDPSNFPPGSPYAQDNEINIAPNVVNPGAALPATVEQMTRKTNTKNFIPYPKTGALMMVVRWDSLPKLKDLLRKLDVPKKMVQIEVLLCEKKTNYTTKTGLNLLKLGSDASGVRKTAIDFNVPDSKGIGRGIFDFFISRPKTAKHIPPYDITYQFLLSQEDILINASPSVTTVNHTPATINLVEEISINSGAAPIETNSNITFEKAFLRKQYGITIVLTPTIHEPGPDDEDQDTLVTLDTNITFDTQKSDIDDRPKIDRRHLQNQVRVIDGQTIVIGGLRRKDSEDRSDKIPFLGEIPGIAKLFGISRMSDTMTEMFIFITPRVINDPRADIEKIKEDMYVRRAGDCPEYLCRLLDAQCSQKKRLFARSFNLIFGNSL